MQYSDAPAENKNSGYQRFLEYLFKTYTFSFIQVFLLALRSLALRVMLTLLPQH
jgi:hypothetical protein